MKNLILVTIVFAMIFTSCENAEKSTETTQSENTEFAVVDEVTPINVADFDDKVGDYVGKKIQLEGTVDHICTHGGQRMFLVCEESDARIKITPDEEIAAFNAELEGDKIVLVGIVEEQRIDEAYLREWEEEVKAGSDMSDDKGEGVHLGGKMEKGGDHSDIAEEMEKVNHLRTMLQDSGKDHLSFYSVLCTSYDVKEANDQQADQEGDHDHDHEEGHSQE